MDKLKLIVLDNFKDFGDSVVKHLHKLDKRQAKYSLKTNVTRFNNGEGKVIIDDCIRDIDVYILSDVGNYGMTYELHGHTNYMGPDEHYQDIKRVLSALSGYANRITLVTPLLYQSRQDKRHGRESLDCAISLQELERLGVNHIIGFDVHNPNVSNAIPNLPFENFFPTNTILRSLIKKENVKDLLVISPDMGAMERARYYAEILGCDVGVFYKRRDLSKVVDGKNPIVEHSYMGCDVKNKNIIIVDDMIASGGSMLEVAEVLKSKGANNIYFVVTYALFTEGLDKFNIAYREGIFNKLYTTNLSYIPKEYQEKRYFEVVDMSKSVAEIIDYLHDGKSLKPLLNKKEEIKKIMKDKEKKISKV